MAPAVNALAPAKVAETNCTGGPAAVNAPSPAKDVSASTAGIAVAMKLLAAANTTVPDAGPPPATEAVNIELAAKVTADKTLGIAVVEKVPVAGKAAEETHATIPVVAPNVLTAGKAAVRSCAMIRLLTLKAPAAGKAAFRCGTYPVAPNALDAAKVALGPLAAAPLKLKMKVSVDGVVAPVKVKVGFIAAAAPWNK